MTPPRPAAAPDAPAPAPAARRLRVIAWIVQPVTVADDGDTLTEIAVQPQRITAAAWQAFKDGGDDAALAGIRAQVEQPAPPEPG